MAVYEIQPGEDILKKLDSLQPPPPTIKDLAVEEARRLGRRYRLGGFVFHYERFASRLNRLHELYGDDIALAARLYLPLKNG